eukprot:gene6658-9139_t
MADNRRSEVTISDITVSVPGSVGGFRTNTTGTGNNNGFRTNTNQTTLSEMDEENINWVALVLRVFAIILESYFGHIVVAAVVESSLVPIGECFQMMIPKVLVG